MGRRCTAGHAAGEGRPALPPHRRRSGRERLAALPRWVDSHCHLPADRRRGGRRSSIGPGPAGSSGWSASGPTWRRPGPRSRSPSATPTSAPPSACTPTTRAGSTTEWDGARRAGPATPRVVAIGEAASTSTTSTRRSTTQEAAFRAQIQLAHATDRALVIHSREAWDDTFRVLDDEGVPPRTVFHCFTGGPDEARRALDLGTYLSFSGIVTFKNARRRARGRGARARSTACWSRPTRRTSRRCRTAGGANEPACVAVVGAAVAAPRGRGPVDAVAAATAATAARRLRRLTRSLTRVRNARDLRTTPRRPLGESGNRIDPRRSAVGTFRALPGERAPRRRGVAERAAGHTGGGPDRRARNSEKRARIAHGHNHDAARADYALARRAAVARRGIEAPEPDVWLPILDITGRARATSTSRPSSCSTSRRPPSRRSPPSSSSLDARRRSGRSSSPSCARPGRSFRSTEPRRRCSSPRRRRPDDPPARARPARAGAPSGDGRARRRAVTSRSGRRPPSAADHRTRLSARAPASWPSSAPSPPVVAQRRRCLGAPALRHDHARRPDRSPARSAARDRRRGARDEGIASAPDDRVVPGASAPSSRRHAHPRVCARSRSTSRSTARSRRSRDRPTLADAAPARARHRRRVCDRGSAPPRARGRDRPSRSAPRTTSRCRSTGARSPRRAPPRSTVGALLASTASRSGRTTRSCPRPTRALDERHARQRVPRSADGQIAETRPVPFTTESARRPEPARGSDARRSRPGSPGIDRDDLPGHDRDDGTVVGRRARSAPSCWSPPVAAGRRRRAPSRRAADALADRPPGTRTGPGAGTCAHLTLPVRDDRDAHEPDTGATAQCRVQDRGPGDLDRAHHRPRRRTSSGGSPRSARAIVPTSTSRTEPPRRPASADRCQHGPVALLTPATITELLERHDLRPSRALGQHFLADPNTARRIVRLAAVGAGDHVLEIGPGHRVADRRARRGRARRSPRSSSTATCCPCSTRSSPSVPRRARRAGRRADRRPRRAARARPGALEARGQPPVQRRDADGRAGARGRARRSRSLLVMVQREVGERLAAPSGRARTTARSR